MGHSSLATRGQFRGIGEIAFLLERHLGLVALAGALHCNQGGSRLLRKALHDFVYGLAGGFRNLVPEVFGRGIPVRMLRKIGVDALLKYFRPDISFHHAQHRCSLAIGDSIEERLDVRGSFRVRANGPDGGHRIIHKRPQRFPDLLLVNVPFRFLCCEGFPRHPGRKPFVQPDVIPPFHGHKVAKPLVRHFVGNHRRHLLPCVIRGRLLVNQQRAVSIGNGADILHCPRGKVREHDVIQLFVRIFDRVVLVVILQDVFRDFQREAGHLLLLRQ